MRISKLAVATTLMGLLACGVSACGGGGNMICRRDPQTGFERCDAENNYGEAVVTGAIAGGLWAAEGCKINGCEPPYRCNAETERCERPTCGTDTDCPVGYMCDLESSLCK
jgi:hypothetical protein